MSAAVCEIKFKKLKYEDVLCPICRGIYIEPIPLPCKHIFCLQCLEKTVENNSLVCPICRTRIGTFLRLAKNLKKIVDQGFWQRVRNQFPIETQKKLVDEEDGVEKNALGEPRLPKLADKGAIKEEFDEMFHKLKIQEERSRRAEQIASEELAKRIMQEEMKQEEERRRKSEAVVKSDVRFIKSLILSEKGQKGKKGRPDLKEEGNISSSSSVSNDHDSISDEMRHFTPICIAPKTPPKRLPNGKLRDTTIIKPVNLSIAVRTANTRARFGSLKNKMPLKILSNNFLRTKPPPPHPPPLVEDVEMGEEMNPTNNCKKPLSQASDLNSNITQELPSEIIKEQELIQLRIKQEQEDMAMALKLHNKWNKSKAQVKRKHGYQLRSVKKNKTVS